MKARIVQFYQDKIQPRIAALKVRVGQLKQRVTGWLTRHQHHLRLAVVVITLGVTGLVVAYLWQRSPAFRTLITKVGGTVAGGLASLWVLFKGRPVEVPVPVAVTEQPWAREEAAFPVEPGYPV